MSVLSLGSFHSCCASPVHEGKDSELVVAEYTATKGSAVYQRPAFLPPPLPLYKEEHRLPLARVKPSRPLESRCMSSLNSDSVWDCRPVLGERELSDVFQDTLVTLLFLKTVASRTQSVV